MYADKFLSKPKITILSIILLITGILLNPSIIVASLVGEITNPLTAYGDFTEATTFLNYIIRLITIIAGLYAFANFVLAGLQYIQSSGNPEGVSQAWTKIYQSIIGLAIVILAYVLAALLGLILFGNATAILSPTIYGPN